jgi:hypothetical protein
MRRTIRFSIAGLMGIVVVAAIGLAALRNASDNWAGVMLLLTCGTLALAIVGVVCRTEGERAWWLGFALFGWGYLALAFWSWHHAGIPSLPTLDWLIALTATLGANPQPMGPGGGIGGMGGMGGGMRSVRPFMVAGGFGGGPGGGGWADWYVQVGHCLWALVLAILGGILARALFALPAGRSETPRDVSRPGWRRWARPAGVGALGLVLVTLLFTVRSRSAPGIGSGATFLLTWALLGFTALGAILDRRRRGEIWLGAALFGAGYMILAFGREPAPFPVPHLPILPTDQFLLSLKSWLPRSAEGFFVSTEDGAANARILKALDERIAMHFADETPLDDVLQHIRLAARGPDGKGIPIYVDPIGLQEAERSLTSTVTIDLEGVPLGTTLHVCLKQLGLAYCIRDGFLTITSEESASPVYEDPFLIGGHCALALFAAALGGVLAPLVSSTPRESH